MNTSSPATNAAFQSPQIIRISTYPRAVIDRKPDDQSLESVQRSNYLLYPSPPQTSASSASPTVSSATVPQIVNILNPLISTIALPNPNMSSNGGMIQNAKKCTFHQQCLHLQHQHHQSSTTSGSQSQNYQQNTHLVQQQHQQPTQQVRINNQIPAVNRNSAQANRDAISSNVQPTLNAALLQDRYLLLDMVDGSSFYKCIDIQTQKILVCKVRKRTMTLLCLILKKISCVLDLKIAKKKISLVFILHALDCYLLTFTERSKKFTVRNLVQDSLIFFIFTIIPLHLFNGDIILHFLLYALFEQYP